MADDDRLYELAAPGGKTTIKVTADRAAVFRARGYTDVGSTAKPKPAKKS